MGRGSWTTAAILAAAGKATELNHTTIAYPHAMCTTARRRMWCRKEREAEDRAAYRLCNARRCKAHTYIPTHPHIRIRS